MPPDGPFSPSMVSVYATLATILTLIVKGYFESKERKRVQDALLEEAKLRRQWEVEDRAEKKKQSKTMEDAKKAAITAARNAVESKQQVAASRGERAQQMEEIKAEVKASSAASAEALNVANGHNQKILEATQLAAAALEHSKTTITVEPMTEKPVVPLNPT